MKKAYIVKRAVSDAMEIKMHLDRTGVGLKLAVYELAELLDNMREYGHTEAKHQRAEMLIDYLFGTMDSLEHVGEELVALEKATIQKERTEAVKKVATTPPEKRGQIDAETLWLAGVYDDRTKEQILEDAKEAQVPKEIGDIALSN